MRTPNKKYQENSSNPNSTINNKETTFQFKGKCLKNPTVELTHEHNIITY